MALEGADKDKALETIMVAQTAGEDPPYHPEPGKILAALEKEFMISRSVYVGKCPHWAYGPYDCIPGTPSSCRKPEEFDSNFTVKCGGDPEKCERKENK